MKPVTAVASRVPCPKCGASLREADGRCQACRWTPFTEFLASVRTMLQHETQELVEALK